LVFELRQAPLLVLFINSLTQEIAKRSLNPSLINKEKIGTSLVFCLLKIRHKNPKKNDTQYGYNYPTVELSQTINDFQQQQTGRLL